LMFAVLYVELLVVMATIWWMSRKRAVAGEGTFLYMNCKKCKQKIRYHERQIGYSAMCRRCKHSFVYPAISAEGDARWAVPTDRPATVPTWSPPAAEPTGRLEVPVDHLPLVAAVDHTVPVEVQVPRVVGIAGPGPVVVGCLGHLARVHLAVAVQVAEQRAEGDLLRPAGVAVPVRVEGLAEAVGDLAAIDGQSVVPVG